MRNIENAVKCVNYHIKKKNKIKIISDSRKSLQLIYKSFYRFVDDDLMSITEQSELPMNFYSSLNFNLLIVIGFGGEDYYMHEELTKHGIDIIIFDEGKSEFAIVINGYDAMYDFCTALNKYWEE